MRSAAEIIAEASHPDGVLMTTADNGLFIFSGGRYRTGQKALGR
jgi:hypothetical protein